MIFIYSQQEGTLDIFLAGGKRPVPDLQRIFSETILGVELGPDKKDEQVYDLDPLKSRSFQFVYNPGGGIDDVLVRKIRLSNAYRKNERIILEAEPDLNRHAVYDLLDKLSNSIQLSQYHVSQVCIKAVLSPACFLDRGKPRSFTITHPNSCSLKQDDRDLILRKMLAASGLEPRDPSAAEDVEFDEF